MGAAMAGARPARFALDLVEAAYRLDGEPEQWLRGVVEAAAPGLDHGFGALGWTCRLTRTGRLEMTSRITATGGVPRGIVEVLEGFYRASGTIARRVHATPMPFETASAAYRRAFNRPFTRSRGFDPMRRCGVEDAIGATACDPTGLAVLLVGHLPERRATVDPRDAARWRRLMPHVLAGLRIRTGLAAPDAEAIVDDHGRVVHAEGPARSRAHREALRARAREVDRARSTRGRSEPDRALEAWKGLVAGRWSLLDQFESDGRRYLVARRNDLVPTVAKPLTHRERQVLSHAALGYTNKEIAYALGLAPSTVSSHLVRGLRTLGVSDRASLAALWPSLTAPDDERRPDLVDSHAPSCK